MTLKAPSLFSPILVSLLFFFFWSFWAEVKNKAFFYFFPQFLSSKIDGTDRRVGSSGSNP
jgi:hypothetical protein